MRPISCLSSVTFLVLGISHLASSQAILAIDFGTEFIKAHLSKTGVYNEIVLTKDSRRKEAAAIAFKPNGPTHIEGTSPERLYGADAVNFAARFPKDVYPNLKPLLGAYIMDDSVSAYSKRYSALSISSADRSTVAFQSTAAPDGKFTVEELIAMQLGSIRASAETMAKIPVINTIITVPPFFSSEEKYALQKAAEIAGLRVAALMTDGAAVAVSYVLSRAPDPAKPPQHHIIYDMGSGSTKASVVRLEGIKGKGREPNITEITVLGVGFDRTLGGDHMNQKVNNWLLQQFIDSPAGKALAKEEGKDIKEVLNGKSYAKLWREAGRVRTMLSANSEAFASIESIYPDVDLKRTKITRAEYEDMLKCCLARITKPIETALKNANLPGGLKDIESIILTGGAIRTPLVQKTITDFVGEDVLLAKNVNGDEAASHGACVRGSIISKIFRVKGDIRVFDANTYDVVMRYTPETAEKEIEQVLFPAPSRHSQSKFIPIKRSTDFTFNFHHVLSSDKKPKKEEINSVTTSNLTASFDKLKADFGCTDASINTTFEIRLNSANGLPEVVKGEVSCEFMPKKDTGAVDGVKGFFGFGKKSASEKSESASKSKSTTSTKSGKSKSSKTGSTSASPTSTEPVMRTEKINIAFTVKHNGLQDITPEALKASIKRLEVFNTDDKNRKLREEARNELEGYTYKCMEYLSSDAFIAVSTKAEQEKLQAKLSEVSDWIYTKEAEMSTREALSDKLKELSAIEKPISKRRRETEKRPKMVEDLRASMEEAQKYVETMKEKLAAHHERASKSKEAAAKSSSEAEAAASAQAASASSWEAEAAASASSDSAENIASDENTAAAESPKPSAKPSLSDSVDPSDTTSETISTVPSPADGFEELERETSTTSATTSTKTKTKKKPSKPKPTPPPFTKEDIDALNQTLNETQVWLEKQVKLQDDLKPHEDPVLLVRDIKKKHESLKSQLKMYQNLRRQNFYIPPGADGSEMPDDAELEELLRKLKAGGFKTDADTPESADSESTSTAAPESSASERPTPAEEESTVSSVTPVETEEEVSASTSTTSVKDEL